MPRQDWHDDGLMSRDRRDFEGRRDRNFRDFGDRERDRGAFFDDDRPPRTRSRSSWSLLGDESSGGRMRDRPDGRRERGFGPDDDRSDIPRDETERLIASNKVEGTPVYDRNGDRLGTIHNFMVDKFRGRVVYAVLRHGSGFLGLDDRYYPLDWDQLTFDTRLGGYRINMTEDRLKEMGSWDRNERWSDRQDMRRDRDYDRNVPW